MTGVIIVLVFAVSGCVQNEEEEESQDAHVCEHLTYGPSIALQASPYFQAALDSLIIVDSYRVQAQLHTRYDVELTTTSGNSYAGYIPYKPIGDEGDYLLYLDHSADVTLLNGGDSTIVQPEAVYGRSDDCATIAFKAVFHLEVENTYLLAFENSSESVIGILFPMSIEQNEDHDH